MINFSLVIIIIVFGIVVGIIGGALWLIIKIMLSQKKAIKDYENGKVFEVKGNENENDTTKIKKKEIIKDTKKKWFSIFFKKKNGKKE